MLLYFVLAVIATSVVADVPIRVINGSHLSSPYDLEFNRDGSLLVNNADNNIADTLCFITSDGTLINKWGYGQSYIPNDIAVDTDGYLYVTLPNTDGRHDKQHRCINCAGANIIKIDLTTRQIVDYWKLGFLPVGIALDNQRKILYTRHFGSTTIAKFSFFDGTHIGDIDVHQVTNAIAIDQDSGNVFVTTSSNNIVKLTNDGTILAVFNTTMPALSAPFGIAVNPITSNIVFADYSNARLVQMDSQSGTVTHIYSMPKLYPRQVAIEPITGNIFVTANLDNKIYVFGSQTTTKTTPSPVAS